MSRSCAGAVSNCVASISVAAICLCALACNPQSPTRLNQEQRSIGDSSLLLPVTGTAVVRGDLVMAIRANGQVQSVAVAKLRAEAEGTVAKVFVAPGDLVPVDQPLISLDPEPLLLALDEAEAAAAQARVSFLDLTVPDSILTGIGPDSVRRASARARSGLLAAEVRVARARLNLTRSSVTAPFPAVVDRISVTKGERVALGQELAIVVDLAHLFVEAHVLEHDLPLLTLGARALMTSPAAPGQRIMGIVTTILPLIDTVTRAGRVVIALSPTASRFVRPGIYLDVQIESARLKNRLLIGKRAILERDGRTMVFVAKGKRAQWTYVSIGRANERFAEVLPDSLTGVSPLSIGDTVLVDGHLTLTHDAPISVVFVDSSSTGSRKD